MNKAALTGAGMALCGVVRRQRRVVMSATRIAMRAIIRRDSIVGIPVGERTPRIC
jgi:hypothetical protein